MVGFGLGIYVSATILLFGLGVYSTKNVVLSAFDALTLPVVCTLSIPVWLWSKVREYLK